MKTFIQNLEAAQKQNRKWAPVIVTSESGIFTDPFYDYDSIFSHYEGPMCLLESVVSGEKNRYSFICVDGENSIAIGEEDSIDNVKQSLSEYSPFNPTEIPFIGGMIGYIGHETICKVEKTVRPNREDPFKTPHACLCFFRKVIVYDHLLGKTHFIVNVPVHSLSSSETAYKEAIEEIARIQNMIVQNDTDLFLGFAPGKKSVAKAKKDYTLGAIVSRDIHRQTIKSLLDNSSNMTEEEYTQMVLRAKTHIEQGDAFQIVLSQRFSIPYQENGIELYEELRKLNPSPYMFHMRFGKECRGMTLFGASPEVMVEIQNGNMRIKPIAGTRKRGKDKEEDDRLSTELLSDPKEIAEHRMLVDLARNDIGKFCRAESVEVTKLLEVENYSHVMHIVSEVKGQLRKNMHPFDACLGSLPAGTLSGAPKVRALELISELEKTQRGPYGGAFGWFTDSSLDTCIFIRSTMLLDGMLHWQSGGGVVADSDPKAEYEESLMKAKAIRTVVEKVG